MQMFSNDASTPHKSLGTPKRYVQRLIPIDFQIQEIIPVSESQYGIQEIIPVSESQYGIQEIIPVSESQYGLINVLH